MGQIQSAINAGIGSIIGAKAMAEHLQGQALNAVENQYNEAAKIGEDAQKLASKIKEQSDIEEAAKDVIKESNEKLKIEKPRDEKTGRFVNKKEYQRKLDMDIEEANKSLQEVHKEQRATAAQSQAFQARMDFYNKRQGLLQDSLDKLPAKKRPGQPDLNKIVTQDQWNAIDLIKRTNKENK